ncbi:hypothetical protein D3C86_1633910 [compost metagenome]
MAPAIETAKHRSGLQLTECQPVFIRLHRTQSFERRHTDGTALMLTVAFAAGEKQAQTFTGEQLVGFNPQTTQIVTAKPSPKTQQQQSPIATSPQAHRQIGRRLLQQ